MKRAAFLILASAAAAFAWDPAGHMIVGEIAWQRSSPAVREKVDALVRTLDASHAPGHTYTFTSAGCWMDDMRSKRPYPWGPLHYVDIEKTDDGSGFKLPPPPHIISCISDSLAALRDPQATPERRTILSLRMSRISFYHRETAASRSRA